MKPLGPPMKMDNPLQKALGKTAKMRYLPPKPLVFIRPNKIKKVIKPKHKGK